MKEKSHQEYYDEKPIIVAPETPEFEEMVFKTKYESIEYRLHYQLELSETDYLKVQKFLAFKGIQEQYTPIILELLTNTHVCVSDWRDFGKDLRSVSRGVRDVLFTVCCHGEDGPYEMKSAFALNGGYYEHCFEVSYPVFQISRLRGAEYGCVHQIEHEHECIIIE